MYILPKGVEKPQQNENLIFSKSTVHMYSILYRCLDYSNRMLLQKLKLN